MLRSSLLSALALIVAVAVPEGPAHAQNAGHGMKITSTAFAEGQPIPKRYTCDGENVSPPLAWSGVPAAAKGLVLVVDDPDAPGGLFTHWIVFNLPPSTSSLPEGVKPAGGISQGTNDFGKAGYGGPCPPKGRHRYVFHLFALESGLDGLTQPSRAKLDAALEKGHVLARTALTGTYQR
jgi:Raf kinase inhibitor-like YbhB/YbcL family protein